MSDDFPVPTLVGGNPHCHRATFTRFLLPFQWVPRQLGEIDRSKPHFRRADDGDWLRPATATASFASPHLDAQRRRYLTIETDSLLFTHAAWFVLESPGEARNPWREFDVASDIGGGSVKYRVALRAPALVLFECSSASERDRAGERDESLLRNGFLIHEAYFPKDTPRFADLLRFNEIFRYWRCPFPDHAEWCSSELKSFALGVRGVSGRAGAEPLYEAQWGELMSLPVEFQTGSAFSIVPESARSDDVPAWLINPDDRAFTMPFAVVAGDNQAALYSAFLPPAATPPPPLHQAGYWVKLLNVDRPVPWEVDHLGLASTFEVEWANERTYRRWVHSGTLYGFCEHAFAALVPAATENGRPAHGEPPLGLHFGAMYLDVTLLLLYLRVSVLRFSQRLHAVTREALQEKGWRREAKRWRERFHALRWQFLLLENLYQYPHLSNQQQHLEMYGLQRKAMDVPELYQEIDKEVRASDEFLSSELDQERNDLAANLNIVAVFGLAAALALGWMDAHSETQSGPWYAGALFATFLVLAAAVMLLSRPVGRVFSTFSKLQGYQRALLTVLLILSFLALTWWLPRVPGLGALYAPNAPCPSPASL